MAESVYGGDIQSIDTDHCPPPPPLNPVLVSINSAFPGQVRPGTCHPPLAPPSPAGPDCDAAEGRVENIMCPYLSILMEHCYHCYNPNTTTGEVVVCEGWSEEDIRAQCESPEPLSAPSPSPVSSL